jgi:hypothetical protein
LEVHEKRKKRRLHREEKTSKMKRWKFGLLEIWKFMAKKDAKGKTPKIKRWKFGLLEIWKMKNAMKGDKKPPIRLCKQEDRENQKEKQNGVLLTYFCG